tara:strand:- start:220 stop:627 length:408 start_codon:yes stop_codon:yes gene_type:complete
MNHTHLVSKVGTFGIKALNAGLITVERIEKLEREGKIYQFRAVGEEIYLTVKDSVRSAGVTEKLVYQPAPEPTQPVAPAEPVLVAKAGKTKVISIKATESDLEALDALLKDGESHGIALKRILREYAREKGVSVA